MKQPLDRMASLFQALGDPTRLRILGLLLTGEVCVCHIHESLRIPQPKASRHLAYLRRSGLVDTRREGLWVYYRLIDLADPVVGTIRHAVTDDPRPPRERPQRYDPSPEEDRVRPSESRRSASSRSCEPALAAPERPAAD